jgi:hypothetical protein
LIISWVPGTKWSDEDTKVIELTPVLQELQSGKGRKTMKEGGMLPGEVIGAICPGA